ncbi:hypothetical protein GCM10022221_72740 [Actinocorallia aurea]
MSGHEVPGPANVPPGVHPQGGYFPGPPAAPTRDGLAIASLVLALVGAVCVSVPLGIVALVRARRAGGGGKGFAIAGIAVSAGWLVVGSLVAAAVLVWVGDLKDERLKPGVCYNETGSGETPEERTVTGCTSPHTIQVLSVAEQADEPYPGGEEIGRRADAECHDPWFPRLLQSPYAEAYELTYLTPTSYSWRFDRRIVCLLESSEGKTSTFVDLAAVKVDPAREPWSELAVRDCFDLPDEASYSVATVACDEPHDAQVVKVFSLPEGPWPGPKRVEERAEALCQDRLDRFFADHPPAVRTAYSSVTPTRKDWAAKDRRVLCLVESGHEDTALTDSLVP